MPRPTARIANFVEYVRRHITGDEKGEAHLFCERLFRAFGHEGLREAGGMLDAPSDWVISGTLSVFEAYTCSSSGTIGKVAGACNTDPTCCAMQNWSVFYTFRDREVNPPAAGGAAKFARIPRTPA